MSAAHTPGPWKADHTYDVNCGNGYLIACVHAGEASAGSPSGGDDIAEANAHLIAAAPDMLKALRLVLDADQMAVDQVGLGAFMVAEAAAIQAVRAAIAKAEGRS